ncbi:MAG: NAD(P)H-dependent oxidoreductase [Anaerolineae bacterium]
MIRRELLRREAEGCPIRVGASAVGWMGSGFVAAMAHVPGMQVSALANANVEEGIAAFTAAGIPRDAIVVAEQPGPAGDAIAAGKRVVTGSPALLARIDALDIVTDCTWSPALGAEVAYACIQHGKDVVLINIEADVTVGRMLNRLAGEAGVLYSVSSGDEPGCLMELYDFVTSLGYEVIAIGKGKNNPLDPYATPDSVAEPARQAAKDPWQVASYVDGTKTMFEMACAANATGCQPVQRGMIGPEATLETVSQVFALQADGGLIPAPGAVDFVQGSAMAGGVFITVRITDTRIQDDLRYLKVGKGAYVTFFRPYHLWFLEAPISIARAHLYGEQWLAPLDQPAAEVMTVAKRDLTPGERLDDFGGYTFYGVIDRAETARSLNALPVGLAPGAGVIKPVARGQIVTWDAVALDESSTVVKLRRQQDALPDVRPPILGD